MVRSMIRNYAAIAVAIGACLLPVLAADDGKEPRFSHDVAPILLKRCLACHGAKAPKGDYQLDTFQHLLKAGKSGETAIVPGQVDDSELFRRLVSRDSAERMPQDAEPLSRQQIGLIRAWIAAGAKFDGSDPATALTSLAPPPVHPAPPPIYPRPLPITALALSPSGEELAVGGYHEVTIWNPRDGTLLRRIPGLAERTLGLAYRPDGKTLAAASGNPGELGEVNLLDPAAGKVVRSLLRLTDVATCVAYDTAGKRLAAGGADRAVHIFRVDDGKERIQIDDHADAVTAIAWRNDDKQLVTASRDKTCKLFDPSSGHAIATFRGHTDPVLTVAFSSDGKRVASAGRDQKLRIWHAKEHETKQDSESSVSGEVFQLLTVGEQLWSSGADRTVRQFDFAAGKPGRKLEHSSDFIYSLSLCAEQHLLAAGSHNGTVTVWNSETGEKIIAFAAAPK